MPATADDRLLGGRYRLGEPLGRGGMGVVWAGRDELLGRDVAIKEVVPPLDLPIGDREMLRRRTLREARAAARISSPAAVTVYDVVEEDGRPWIVMERLTTRSLADVLQEEGPLSARRAAEVGLDVLDALEAAASVGVLHRDVKPANVMLLTTGRAVLTDFGIATVAGDATVTTTGLVVGSPAYMSPERARGERSTLASDLWSLGATLYAALDGHSPFERSGTLPTLSAVLHDPAPLLVHGGELQGVIDALLVKEPAERPNLGRVRAALQRIVAGEETRPLAPGAVTHESTHATPPPGPGDAPTAPTSGDSEPPVTAAPETKESPNPPVLTTRALPAAANGDKQSAIESWLEGPEEERPTTRRRRAGPLLLGLLMVGLLVTVALIFLYDWRSPGTGATLTESERSGGSEPTAAVESRRQTEEAAASPPPASTPDATAQAPNPAATSGGIAGPAAPAADPLPAGFRLHTDPTGFTIAVPADWTRSTEGPRTYFREPGGGRFLLVDQTTEPKDDPLADWQAQEPSVAGRLSGYERISMDRVDYRGWNTVDWEFTWDGRTAQIHVLNRNVRVSDSRAYALYWSTPEHQWADSRGIFDVVAQNFQPAPD
jgi:serine/threonine protein kinase